MKKYCILLIVSLAACTPKGSHTTGNVDSTAVIPPLDSTVQHKIPPDTLVRGDGQRCTVGATKYTVAELGQPFICDWR